MRELVDKHVCNAYCRDGKHADISWVSNCHQSREETTRRLGLVMRVHGMRLHSMEPAREIRRPDFRVPHYDRWGALDRIDTLPGDAVPYLITYEYLDAVLAAEEEVRRRSW